MYVIAFLSFYIQVIDKQITINTVICSSLTSITIGTGVSKLKDAFNCLSPIEVRCYVTTPPELDLLDFSGVDKSKSKLYVPKGTYQVYFLSKWGERFSNIIEMED